MQSPVYAKKIALLGGAFNPPTLAHLELAKYLLAQNEYDELWLMPVYAHKFSKAMADFGHRMQMCTLMCDSDPRLKISDFESQIASQSDGSTWELLCALREAYADCEFQFIMGMDNALSIERWHRWSELIQNFAMIVFPRPGQGEIPVDAWFLSPPHRFVAEIPPMDLSSTQVRRAIELGEESLSAIHPDVEAYIRQHKLYF